METNSLLELKEILENMKNVLNIIAEAKLKNLEQIKKDFTEMVDVAQQMELEKNLINNIEEVQQSVNDVKEINQMTAKIIRESYDGFYNK